MAQMEKEKSKEWLKLAEFTVEGRGIFSRLPYFIIFGPSSESEHFYFIIFERVLGLGSSRSGISQELI